jgi:hypothetical protein
MSQLAAKNTLRHALLWLRSEKRVPPFAVAGVTMALREIGDVPIFHNRAHRPECKRCAEILAAAEKSELEAELRANGIDPAELNRKMLDRLEAKATNYERWGATPPSQFTEALRQFREASLGTPGRGKP